MDNSFLAIALLALATVLIVAEIFIPSGGVLAAGMFASLGASFYFAWLAWWDESRVLFFGFTTFSLICIPGVAILALSWLPKTKFGKRILLEGPKEEDVVPFAKEEELLNMLVGQIAKTITPLVPGGLISINRERIHAFSEGVIIEANVDVEIIKAIGTRVMVREVRSDAKTTQTENDHSVVDDGSSKQTTSTDTQDPLDFDLSNTD
ncbi:MAG: hypothetical protein JKY95_02330 [Planctomycetaceae bacterium]|nr:hypothetical protein [Planctomycetaceae bacterium]